MARENRGGALALLLVGTVMSSVVAGAVIFAALSVSSGTADPDFSAILAVLVGLAPLTWYLLRLRTRASNGGR